MNFADSSRTRLAYIAEVTDNVIPSNPSWQTMRYVDDQLVRAKQTRVSNEIRGDGNIPDIADVGFRVEGPISLEWSYGTMDTILESVLRSTWQTNVIKNGVIPKSLAWEKTVETDSSGTADVYLRFTGCQHGSITWNIAAEEIIGGETAIVGRGHDAQETLITGATYQAPNTNAVMTGSKDIAAFTIGGATYPVFNGTITVANELAPRLAIANYGPVGVRGSRYAVNYEFQIYIQDLTLYNKGLNHDDVDVALTLGSVTNEKYTISMPRSKITEHPVPTPGIDQDMFMNISGQAIYHAATDATIEITRAVA